MNIPKKIAELRQMLIVHQTEMGYHIFDEVLMILAWLNKRVDDNSTECFSLVERINRAWPDPPQEELKPCPCCPNKHVSIYYNQDEDKTKYYGCDNCGIRTADFATEHEARETWQRRSNV